MPRKAWRGGGAVVGGQEAEVEDIDVARLVHVGTRIDGTESGSAVRPGQLGEVVDVDAVDLSR
ncbi:MAG: hypothetical protein EBS94_13245 [Proteobacteria bacterium]|nr:hypothetical protein [Pseudomonadota bacterium]